MMDRLRGLRLRLRSLFRRHRVERELDDEVRLHIEMETEAGVRRGHSPAAARREALVRFGGVERFKEEARAVRPGADLEILWQDLRLALRSLRRRPGFAAAGILTLGLGLAGLVSGYALLYGVVLRPLPYPEAERLVSIWQTMQGWSRFPASYPILERWSEARSLESVAAYAREEPWLGGAGGQERVPAAATTASLPAVLGVSPRLGRWFTEAEDRSGERVVVVSDAFWRTRLGGADLGSRPSVVLDDESHAVTGVMPPGFGFPGESVAVWVPLGPETRTRGWTSQGLAVVGRLAPGATVASADGEVRAITERAVSSGESPEVGARVVSRREDLAGALRGTLALSFGALAAVLLIAFLNVAHLFLGRRAGASRELSIRAALGASRLRLMRRMVAEGVVVAALGGALGVALASGALALLADTLPRKLPRMAEVALDAPVLGLAAATTLALGVLLGVVAGFRPRSGPAGVLNAGGRLTPGRGARRFRGVLVAVQVAAVFGLLSGGALMLRSLDGLLSEERGFEEWGVVVLVEPAPPASRYTDDRSRGDLYLGLLPRLRGVPGVEAAAVALPLPFSGSEETGTVTLPSGEPIEIAITEVTPDYFTVLRVPLLAGRTFGHPEDAAEGIVVVSEGLARRLGGSGSAVGRRLDVGGRPMEVVGVVADVRHEDLAAAPGPRAYIPFTGVATEALSVVVRTAGEAGAIVPALRWALVEAEPALGAEALVTLESLVLASVAGPRFRALLLLVLGLTAALLAAVGIHGVTALAVSERAREIAIRLALGAPAGRVAATVVGRELGFVAAGLLAGGAAAAGLGVVLRRFLYEVGPLDPASHALPALMILAIGLAAAAVPAIRAARADPVGTLRAESESL